MALKSPVYLVIFLTYDFEVVLDVEMHCKDSTENSHLPFSQLPHMLTSYINNHGTMIKAKKLAQLQYY